MQIGRRELVAAAAVVLVVGVALGVRRCSRPELDDRQQVAANLQALATGVTRGQAKSVGSYLAPELVWRGMARDELIDNLRGGTFFWRDGRAVLSRVDIVVTGAEATSTGDYVISFRRTADSPMETHGGAFDLAWRKLGGRWQVVTAARMELPR